MTTDELVTDFMTYVSTIIPSDEDPAKVARALLAAEAELLAQGFGN